MRFLQISVAWRGKSILSFVVSINFNLCFGPSFSCFQLEIANERRQCEINTKESYINQYRHIPIVWFGLFIDLHTHFCLNFASGIYVLATQKIIEIIEMFMCLRNSYIANPNSDL